MRSTTSNEWRILTRNRARISPDFWQFLLQLLRSCSTTIVASVLKRHGLSTTLAKTFQELASGADDIFSTPRESASPVDDNVEVGAIDRTVRLLDAITAMLRYLHELGNTEASIRAVLRGTPEVCSVVLGSFLRTLTELVERGQSIHEYWVDTVLGLWRGSVWGNPNFKKVVNPHGYMDALGLILNRYLRYGQPHVCSRPRRFYQHRIDQ